MESLAVAHNILHRTGRISWDLPVTEDTLPGLLSLCPEETRDDVLTQMSGKLDLSKRPVIGLHPIAMEVVPPAECTEEVSFKGTLAGIIQDLGQAVLPVYTGSGTLLVEAITYTCVVSVALQPQPVCKVGFWRQGFINRGEWQEVPSTFVIKDYDTFWPLWGGAETKYVEGRPIPIPYFTESDFVCFKETYTKALAALFLTCISINKLSILTEEE